MQESYYKENHIYYRHNDFKANRKTLVFVHGLSGSSSAWLHYENKFSEDYNVLTYDIRGHGKSHRYRKYSDYEIDKFTEDLYDLVTFLKLNNFIIIGHSYGVFIVLDFLKKHGEFVCGSVLLGPHFNVLKMSSAKVAKFFVDVSTKFRFPIFIKKTRKHLDYSKYLNTRDFNLRRTIADVGNTSLQVFLMCTKQSYLLDYENLLGEIKTPVLLVSGEKDKIFPNEYAQMMAKKIPNSKIVTIKNTDHIIVLNNFKEVSEAIENFVQSF